MGSDFREEDEALFEDLLAPEAVALAGGSGVSEVSETTAGCFLAGEVEAGTLAGVLGVEEFASSAAAGSEAYSQRYNSALRRMIWT